MFTWVSLFNDVFCDKSELMRKCYVVCRARELVRKGKLQDMKHGLASSKTSMIPSSLSTVLTNFSCSVLLLMSFFFFFIIAPCKTNNSSPSEDYLPSFHILQKVKAKYVQPMHLTFCIICSMQGRLTVERFVY